MVDGIKVIPTEGETKETTEANAGGVRFSVIVADGDPGNPGNNGAGNAPGNNGAEDGIYDGNSPTRGPSAPRAQGKSLKSLPESPIAHQRLKSLPESPISQQTTALRVTQPGQLCAVHSTPQRIISPSHSPRVSMSGNSHRNSKGRNTKCMKSVPAKHGHSSPMVMEGIPHSNSATSPSTPPGKKNPQGTSTNSLRESK